MKYAHIDDDGYIVGFYDPEFHDDIPVPNHEIDDGTWMAHLEGSLVKWVDTAWVGYLYDKYRLLDITEMIEVKISEVRAYCQSLIDNAYENPTQTLINIDGENHLKLIAFRRNDRNDKLAGEISLTQEEKDSAKTDQKLSEYEIKCYDASNKAIKEVEKVNDIELIADMEVSTLTTWPTWVAPV